MQRKHYDIHRTSTKISTLSSDLTWTPDRQRNTASTAVWDNKRLNSLIHFLERHSKSKKSIEELSKKLIVALQSLDLNNQRIQPQVI